MAENRPIYPFGDGGPAFPGFGEIGSREAYMAGLPAMPMGGMSLRDHFAGRAMASLVAGPGAQDICDRDPRYTEGNFAEVVALNAYEFADAMIKARQA